MFYILLFDYIKQHKQDLHSRHGLLRMVSQRRKLLDYLVNEYYEHTTSNVDRYSYDMKVVDIIDDFVIAKVYSTKLPEGAFIYRVGDKVHLID